MKQRYIKTKPHLHSQEQQAWSVQQILAESLLCARPQETVESKQVETSSLVSRGICHNVTREQRAHRVRGASGYGDKLKQNRTEEGESYWGGGSMGGTETS